MARISLRSVRELMEKIDKQGFYVVGDAKFPVKVEDIQIGKEATYVLKPVGGEGELTAAETEVEV